MSTEPPIRYPCPSKVVRQLSRFDHTHIPRPNPYKTRRKHHVFPAAAVASPADGLLPLRQPSALFKAFLDLVHDAVSHFSRVHSRGGVSPPNPPEPNLRCVGLEKFFAPFLRHLGVCPAMF